MLYKLTSSINSFDKLEPMPFLEISDLHSNNREKDLENLIAENILHVLFEDAPLLPIFQERSRQKEADIYALNQSGDLIIFELKRSSAGSDAVIQALRYAQDAGQWNYDKLQSKFRNYSGSNSELVDAHKEAFILEEPLDSKQFNKRQELIIIGSAADESLISAVDYWRRQNIAIEFLPYRVYELADEHYFEFFALPYDKHQNPAHKKGVLFDTCRNHIENALWYMMENQCVAAFGAAKHFVDYLGRNDIVFFSHVGVGIVAAAEVKPDPIISPDPDTQCRKVHFLTPIPKRGHDIRAMSFSMVSEITGKNFYWARTIKVPYLSAQESDILVDELNQYLKTNS